MTAGPVLVAGGLGLLGSTVARQLLEEEFEVLVADHFGEFGDGAAVKEDRAAALRTAGATVTRVDLSDPRAVEGVVQALAPEAVVNAALFPEDRPGLAPFLSALCGTSVRYLVHVSDAALYASREPGERARELEPLEPGDDPYLLGRAGEESLVREGALPFTILRVFPLIGPGFPAGRFPENAVKQLRTGEIVTLPDDAPRDFVHPEDAARAVRLALDKRLEGATVNAGSGIDLKPSEVLQALAARLGRALRLNAGPPPARLPRIAETTMAWDLLGFSPRFGVGDIVDELARAARRTPTVLDFQPGTPPWGPPESQAPPTRPEPPPGPRAVSRRELFAVFRHGFRRV